ALAGLDHRITEREPFHDHADEIAVITLADNVLASPSLLDGDRQPFDGLPLTCIKRMIAFELTNERGKRGASHWMQSRGNQARSVGLLAVRCNSKKTYPVP